MVELAVPSLVVEEYSAAAAKCSMSWWTMMHPSTTVHPMNCLVTTFLTILVGNESDYAHYMTIAT